MNFLDDTPRLELFRLAGIPVRVDITFALVPLFLFGILQQAPFAIAGPAFAAIIAGVFLSILLHEIGHATVARLLGVRVGEILVGGFYGYARMLDAPRSTAANVAILFAGPLANGLLFTRKAGIDRSNCRTKSVDSVDNGHDIDSPLPSHLCIRT